MDVVEKANFETLLARNDHRINIMRRGCELKDEILTMATNFDFQTLHGIQKNISANFDFGKEFGRKKDWSPKIKIEHREELVDLFYVDDYEMLTCLPPKEMFLKIKSRVSEIFLRVINFFVG